MSFKSEKAEIFERLTALESRVQALSEVLSNILGATPHNNPSLHAQAVPYPTPPGTNPQPS